MANENAASMMAFSGSKRVQGGGVTAAVGLAAMATPLAWLSDAAGGNLRPMIGRVRLLLLLPLEVLQWRATKAPERQQARARRSRRPTGRNTETGPDIVVWDVAARSIGRDRSSQLRV